MHQDFGGTRTRVVVGGQCHPVRACVEDSQQVSFLDLRKLAVTREKVARLADWPHDVDLRIGRVGIALHRHDLVIGPVEGRTEQIVHCGVGHDKALAVVVFDIENGSDQRAGRPHDGATGLK